jgi:hypothetical protein
MTSNCKRGNTMPRTTNLCPRVSFTPSLQVPVPARRADRLVTHPELSSQFTQRAVASFCPNYLHLFSRQLPLPGRSVGSPIGSSSDAMRGGRGNQERADWKNAFDGPIPVASAALKLTSN